MECQYIPSFKIKLIKAEKKIKESYTDSELERLLKKPDLDSCSFSIYKTWVFENYLLGTGNRISTALDVKIFDLDFQSSTINLHKTKNRKQQIIRVFTNSWWRVRRLFILQFIRRTRKYQNISRFSYKLQY
jgi:integrase